MPNFKPLFSQIKGEAYRSAAVVEVLALKEGDEIEITVTDSRMFKVSRKASRAELLERLRAFRGRLPLDFKFDRDEANAR